MGSFWTRVQTGVSCIARKILNHWTTREALTFFFFLGLIIAKFEASQVVPVVKNSPVNAGDIRDIDSIPGLGRSLEEGMATHSSILAW